MFTGGIPPPHTQGDREKLSLWMSSVPRAPEKEQASSLSEKRRHLELALEGLREESCALRKDHWPVGLRGRPSPRPAR